jgi:uncharacterized OB-fold protein
MSVGAVKRDAATAEFFDATGRGELLIRECRACSRFDVPQATACAHCGSADLTWAVARGTGTVASWTVVYGRALGDGPAPRTVIAIVELDEGPWLQVHLADVPPEAVTAGLKVVVGFERPEGGEAVPVFRPA